MYAFFSLWYTYPILVIEEDAPSLRSKRPQETSKKSLDTLEGYVIYVCLCIYVSMHVGMYDVWVCMYVHMCGWMDDLHMHMYVYRM